MGLNIVVAGGAEIRGFARLYLSRLGHRVRVATTGAEMAEACRFDRPDAVICDSRLPDVDAPAAAVALRGQEIPVVTVARWRDRTRVREFGLPYVEPPLTPLALIAALATACPAAEPEPGRAALAPSA